MDRLCSTSCNEWKIQSDTGSDGREREELKALTLRRKTARALALRAPIVLACAEARENKVVAARQRITPQMVSKRRARFVEHRLGSLLDVPRSGVSRTIDEHASMQ